VVSISLNSGGGGGGLQFAMKLDVVNLFGLVAAGWLGWVVYIRQHLHTNNKVTARIYGLLLFANMQLNVHILCTNNAYMSSLSFDHSITTDSLRHINSFK
jgi:hypothetical protein